jgi:diguanylate cyclase (GGDEF)-like protein
MTRAERELSHVLSEFARTMLTDFPIQSILDHLVQRIVRVLPITGAGVTLIDPPLAPRYVAASSSASLAFEELQSELGEGPCLAAYRTREPVLVSDVRADKRFQVFGPRALEIGLRAVFTFPLRHGRECLGALDLYRDVPGPLTDHEAASAQTLADVTAAYLVNAQARADLQDSSDRSHERSVHDALTGLPNRILLLERMEHGIVRSGRSRKLVAVLFVDLDHFKEVNDAYGHQIGDDLLIGAAERMGGAVRPADTIARLSGDEFVVLCEDLDAVEQVEIVASRIVDTLGMPFTLGDAAIEISASVGIAFAGQTHHDAEQLLHAADLAMYQVKRKGGASYQIIDLLGKHRAESHADLRSALGKAEERGELRIEYQPIVRTEDGQVEGVEALLRWDHPVRGLIPPTTMVPLAEQSGQIIEIGRWVLEQACDDHRSGDHPEGLMLSVNVSAYQLMAPDFVAMVEAILSDTDFDPSLLTLEITEGALVRDTQRAHIVLNELKELGLLLALDDFGTGYSSLSYLKRFPVDVVKIDQSFIVDVARDRSSRAIVSKTIELAHILDLDVVCEGVETKEQHRAVAALGSDFCQGFYFGRPASMLSLHSMFDPDPDGLDPSRPDVRCPTRREPARSGGGAMSAGHRPR